MSWVAAGTAAAGLVAGQMNKDKGGGGGAALGSAPLTPSQITFGSVNYKSKGAGDRGKSGGKSGGGSGSSRDPLEAAMASLVPVTAIGGGVLILALLLKRTN